MLTLPCSYRRSKTDDARNIRILQPFSKKRVMIPDACNALGVRYCDLNTVLKEMGIKI